MSRSDGLRFSITPGAGGWTWSTFGPDRKVLVQGLAPSRNAAAACVIRALARSAAELSDEMDHPASRAA